MTLKTDIIAALNAATEPLDRTAISNLCLSGTNEQIADQLYLLKKAGTIIGEKQRGGTFLYRMPAESEGDVLRRAVDGMVDVGNKTDVNSAVLSMRSEAEVDEIDLERIEEAAEIIRMVEEISDEPKKLPSRDVIERMIAETPSYMETPRYMEVATQDGPRYMNVWPGPTLAERMADPKGTKLQPESDVSERGEAEVEALHSDLIKEQFPELNAKQPERAVSETVEDETEEPIKQEVPPFRVGVYSDGTMTLEKPDEELLVFVIDKAEFAVLVEFARTVGWLPA